MSLETLLLTVLGSGIGSSIVGSILSRRMNRELETLRVTLQRGENLHERQVDALRQLNAKLRQTETCFQEYTSSLAEGLPQSEAKGNEAEKSLNELTSCYWENEVLLDDEISEGVDLILFAFAHTKELTGHGLASQPARQEMQEKASWMQTALSNVFEAIPRVRAILKARAREILRSGTIARKG